jgi:hypothetical protein
LLLLLTGLSFAVLSLGPHLKVLSYATQIDLPYGLLMSIPPFDQERCPVRLAALAMFAFVPLAATGLRCLTDLAARYMSRDWGVLMCGALLCWTIAETPSTVELTHKAYEIPRAALAQLVSAPVTYLPLGPMPCNQAVLQTLHGYPMTNGCLARHSREQLEWAATLERGFEQGDAAYVALLRQIGVQNVVLAGPVAPARIETLRASGLNIVDMRQPQ